MIDHKKKLLEEQRALTTQMRSQREQIEITGKEGDVVDEVISAGNRDFEAKILSRFTDKLRQIEAAIVRIENQTFGICERCGENIAQKRLEAVPWTSFCLSCQEATDTQQHLIAEKEEAA